MTTNTNIQELNENEKRALRVRSYSTLVKMEEFLQSMSVDQISARRLIGLFYAELIKNKTLNACSVDSVVGAILSCAQHGLEPGIAGMVYLIPRKGAISVQIGYRGMIEQAYRTGMVSTIRAYMVYEKDEFEMNMGSECKIFHNRSIGDRGEKIGVYAIVTMKDGEQHFDFMDIDEVEKIRARSGTPNSGPWVTDYDAMAQKTVIRKILKYAPTSVRLNALVSLDEAYEYEGQDLDQVGKVALMQAGVDSNVIDIQPSQSEVLAQKLVGGL